jgi:ribonucleoside-diphosphate reductase alpha chain
VDGSKLNAVRSGGDAPAPAPAAAPSVTSGAPAPDLGGSAAPVPQACSLDDPDCEACQ